MGSMVGATTAGALMKMFEGGTAAWALPLNADSLPSGVGDAALCGAPAMRRFAVPKVVAVAFNNFVGLSTETNPANCCN